MKKYLFIPVLCIAMIFSCTKENVNELNNQTQETSHKKATGSSSHDLLSDNTYKSLVIELVYVEGFKPTQTAINNFVSFLEDRTYKPNGITVNERAIESPGKERYSINDIINIEDENRTEFNSEDQITVWAFFTDGESDKNTDSGTILGTAYRNTSFVIYEKTIQNLSSGTFAPNKNLLETTVITHEFGHILGLTDLGADMQVNHEDPEHEKHCNNNDCLMYWSAETGEGLSNLFGSSNAPTLDSQCIADLQANGGK